jgi:two-component system sensor histidine kinase AgrC
MEESHGFVERFFNFYQEQFLPAIESNDYQTAQEILKNQLDPLFVLHKARIDESSLLIDAQTISTEVFSEAKTNLYSIILFITFFLSIGITVFISLIIFSKIKKNETLIINAKKETESLNTILEENIQKMTRFKHNYDNTLASITGYVYCNNLSGLRDFLAELQFEHKDVDFKKYGALSSLRHHGLIGLILSKMDYAKKQNISFDIQTFGSFSHLRMKPHHICEIIGILLDNAIEGVLETSMRKVCFHISSTSTENHFQISNTIQKLHDPSKIFKEGFSSKGEKRGNGLGIAHKIISSYPNATLNTFIKDNTFTQELVIH